MLLLSMQNPTQSTSVFYGRHMHFTSLTNVDVPSNLKFWQVLPCGVSHCLKYASSEVPFALSIPYIDAL